jgi:hypothetical protein
MSGSAIQTKGSREERVEAERAGAVHDYLGVRGHKFSHHLAACATGHLENTGIFSMAYVECPVMSGREVCPVIAQSDHQKCP